jgi:hypothetical protein
MTNKDVERRATILWWLLLFGMLVMLLLATNTVAANRRPFAEYIYSMENCAACRVLERELSKEGKILHYVNAKPRRVTEFPTVFYSDGTTDTGQLIYRRECKLPRNIIVYKETK